MSKAKTILKSTVLILAVGFIVIQFFRPKLSNPPVDPAETLEANVTVPPDVDQILKHSCFDCHSNQTVYPWYSKVAPASWLVAHDIDEGREKMNLSMFGTYPLDEQSDKLGEICEEVSKGDMPAWQYTIIHRTAKLSDEQRQKICGWTKSAQAEINAKNANPQPINTSPPVIN